mmetsp:Transcript_70658/g.196552  ORF Transcript_70658/g.196552 Transcript_70658/m.196552 type:complete len:383 (+) Transcript_70658:55-1203(+)
MDTRGAGIAQVACLACLALVRAAPHIVGTRYVYIVGHWHGGTGFVARAFHIQDAFGPGALCTCRGHQGEAKYCMAPARTPYRYNFDPRNGPSMSNMTHVTLVKRLRFYCGDGARAFYVLKNPQIGTPAALSSSGDWTGEVDPWGVRGHADLGRWVELLGVQETTVVIVLRHPYTLYPFDAKYKCSGAGRCLSLWADALLLALEPLLRLRVRLVAMVRFEDCIHHSDLLTRGILSASMEEAAGESSPPYADFPRRLPFHKWFTQGREDMFENAMESVQGQIPSSVTRYSQFMGDYFGYNLVLPNHSRLDPLKPLSLSRVLVPTNAPNKTTVLFAGSRRHPVNATTFSSIVSTLLEMSGAPHVKKAFISTIRSLSSVHRRKKRK